MKGLRKLNQVLFATNRWISLMSGLTFNKLICLQVNSKWLLCHLTHDEFKNSVLPAVQKAMLRSPENVMQGRLLAEMSFFTVNFLIFYENVAQFFLYKE